MHRLYNTVLAFYDRNPGRSAEHISSMLKIPANFIRQTRAFLGSSGMLEKDENKNWHITEKAAKSLFEFDREESREYLDFLKNAIDTASKALNADEKELFGFFKMKEGMTNDSFVFYHNGEKYIYRKAGIGSEILVDRRREYANYMALSGKGISDEVVFYDKSTGTKITKFIENSKNISIDNPQHIEKSLQALRNLHNSDIQSPHSFDFWDTIEHYEKICTDNGCKFFDDYADRKEAVRNLLAQVDRLEIDKCFCHIDFVPGNCLMDEMENVILIDWEYSGQQDPIADVAMFCVSADFDRKSSEELLSAYFERRASDDELFRFYTYIATAGLMWSLWSIYKESNGEIFENYTARVYSLCCQYTKSAEELLDKI